jgi:hypothetical protein
MAKRMMAIMKGDMGVIPFFYLSIFFVNLQFG